MSAERPRRPAGPTTPSGPAAEEPDAGIDLARAALAAGPSAGRGTRARHARHAPARPRPQRGAPATRRDPQLVRRRRSHGLIAERGWEMPDRGGRRDGPLGRTSSAPRSPRTPAGVVRGGRAGRAGRHPRPGRPSCGCSRPTSCASSTPSSGTAPCSGSTVRAPGRPDWRKGRSRVQAAAARATPTAEPPRRQRVVEPLRDESSSQRCPWGISTAVGGIWV